MKYVSLLIILLLAHAAMAQDSVHIRGVIQPAVYDSIEVAYNDNKIAYLPHQYTAQVDKNGKFSLSFPVPAGIYIEASARYGSQFAELILHSGDDIALSASGSRFDSSVQYSGRGGDIQNFLTLHFKTRGVLNTYSFRCREQVSKEPDDFLTALDLLKNTEYDFLEKNKTGLPASFVRYWHAYFQYYNYFFMQQYPALHEMLKQRRFTDTIPAASYSVVKFMPYAFYDSLLQVPPYLLYLTGVFEAKLKASGYTFYKEDTTAERMFEDSVCALAYHTLPDKSAEYFIAQSIYGRARAQDVSRTEAQYHRFKQRWPHSIYEPQLEPQIAIARRLAPGQYAPNMAVTTADGRDIKLSDLKGKVVYLHFWAKWCRQCVGEIISEKKIKPLLNSSQVEYVYVSIDGDSTTDHLIISKYKLEGDFTNARGEWAAPEVQLYGIQMLPAYFIIDREGKIALQNAPSPAQPAELVAQIQRLLQ